MWYYNHPVWRLGLGLGLGLVSASLDEGTGFHGEGEHAQRFWPRVWELPLTCIDPMKMQGNWGNSHFKLKRLENKW